MKQTFAELLDWLEKPENEEQIQHLVHLDNLKHVEEVKQIKGFSGIFARFILRITRKHMEALTELSKCKSPADIAAFKQTKYYDKIKNNSAELGNDWRNLENFKKLEELKDIEKRINR